MEAKGLIMRTSSDSAGLLVYRRCGAGPEFLLVHPGGPFWRGRDEDAWSFPKGRIEAGEAPLAAAKREFHEETGLTVAGDLVPLPPLVRRGRGRVFCWLVEADLDLGAARSNTFELKGHWGSKAPFPEIDAFAYCVPALALRRIHESLRPIIEMALTRLGQIECVETVNHRAIEDAPPRGGGSAGG